MELIFFTAAHTDCSEDWSGGVLGVSGKGFVLWGLQRWLHEQMSGFLLCRTQTVPTGSTLGPLYDTGETSAKLVTGL